MEGKQRLVTRTIGDGETSIQIDYIIISNNVGNWLNYSKVKRGAIANSTNQHHIMRMEIRIKFKKQPTPVQLKKHINFNINQLRDNTSSLWIDHRNTANSHAQQQMKNLIEKGKRNASWK